MKRRLKFGLVSILSLIMVLFNFVPVSAIEENIVIPVKISDTETWFFKSVEDYNKYKQQIELGADNINVCGEYSTTKEISRKNVSHKFIGYHSKTKKWSKTSYYKLTPSTKCTVSLSSTYEGILFKFLLNHVTTVETRLNADSSRYSKLALSGDYIVKHMRTFYYDSNGLYDTYDYVSSKNTNKYLDVKYK